MTQDNQEINKQSEKQPMNQYISDMERKIFSDMLKKWFPEGGYSENLFDPLMKKLEHVKMPHPIPEDLNKLDQEQQIYFCLKNLISSARDHNHFNIAGCPFPWAQLGTITILQALNMVSNENIDEAQKNKTIKALQSDEWRSTILQVIKVLEIMFVAFLALAIFILHLPAFFITEIFIGSLEAVALFCTKIEYTYEYFNNGQYDTSKLSHEEYQQMIKESQQTMDKAEEEIVRSFKKLRRECYASLATNLLRLPFEQLNYGVNFVSKQREHVRNQKNAIGLLFKPEKEIEIEREMKEIKKPENLTEKKMEPK